MIKELPHDRAAFEAAKLAGELEYIRTSMVSQYISRRKVRQRSAILFFFYPVVYKLYKNSIKFLGTFPILQELKTGGILGLSGKGVDDMEYLNYIPIEILQLCNTELQLELVINNGMITDCQFGKE